jgi:sulfite exporter TauE/SafE
MIELASISGPATAFLAGLVTSLHCAGMCGPLACALLPTRADDASPQTVSVVYHLTRLAGYGLLGALAGAVGKFPLLLLQNRALAYLPWLLVIFFLAVAFRFDQRLPRVPLLGHAYNALLKKLRAGSRLRAAAALGLATPLLPCGPLYFLISLALLSGSATRGAELLLAFGLGTVPLLWLAQANFHWVRQRLNPRTLSRAQSIFAFALAALLAWRLRSTLGFNGPDALNFICF